MGYIRWFGAALVLVPVLALVTTKDLFFSRSRLRYITIDGVRMWLARLVASRRA